MPIDYKKYPSDWKERRERILKRAKNKCESCGVKNGDFGYRDKEGKFYSAKEIEDALSLRGYDYFFHELSNIDEEDDMPIKIVLTIAHLDHDEENHDVKDERLKALCQRCHLRYDAKEKSRRRKKKKAVNDLFEGSPL